MAGERTHADLAVIGLDVREVAQPTDVDDDRGCGQPQLHQRQQRVATSEQLGVVAELAEQTDGLVDGRRPLVIKGGWDHARASWIAAHTRSGVAGMSMSVTLNGP